MNNIDYEYKWAGVAAGDFYGDSKSEIIALSNCIVEGRNGFYVFNIDGNTINFDQDKSGLDFSTRSKWAGITTGDFVSGGKDDVIMVRNFDNRLYLYKSNGTNIQYVTDVSLDSEFLEQLNLNEKPSIVAIASGNMDGDVLNGDELAVLVNGTSNTHTGLYVFSVDGSNSTSPLHLITKKVGWGVGTEFRGLAVGDFNDNGKDEVVMHRNHDGHYRVYELNSNNNGLVGAGADLFDIRQTKDNVLCAGNFESKSSNDELIALRNGDGGIIMYSNFEYAESANRLDDSTKKRNNDLYSRDVGQMGFVIYPNPNNGILHLDLNNIVEFSKTNVLVEFIDSKGASLMKREIDKSTMDISVYEDGLYFVKISVGSKSLVKKIVKL